MQEMEWIELDFELITPSARIATATHGGRAKCLQRLLRLELPVPKTVAISFSAVHSIAAGHFENITDILNNFGTDDLLCVRPSSESSDWGGPSAIMNIGMNNLRYEELKQTVGPDVASSIYINFIQACNNELSIRTYERGVEGETLACGTGAVGAAMVAVEKQWISAAPVKLYAQGGVLEVDFKGTGPFTDVVLKGPAVKVFEGTIEL